MNCCVDHGAPLSSHYAPLAMAGLNAQQGSRLNPFLLEQNVTGNLLNLLIVDDSVGDARVLQSLIKQARPDGFELVHVLTAGAAHEAIRTTEFDCAFVDYMLDGDSGIHFIRQVRESGNDLPMIAVSGNGSEEVAVESLKQGAQDYIVKGVITPEAVDRSLRNAIEKVALARQLAEKRRELEDFAHVAAHDLRVPLTSVHSLVTLLVDGVGGQCDERALGILKRIEETTVRMSRLLDTLLDYAETGRSQRPLAPVSLATVLSVVLENLCGSVRSAGATIDYTRLPTVMGDDVALTQLFQNLIANAIKFCRERPPVVTISASAREGRWVIAVADNGIGIASEHQERIFAAFSRLHGDREFEGSGIGLATCKRIVDQHGGRIWVESQLGAGTTVYFTLPVVSPACEGLASGQGRHLPPTAFHRVATRRGDPTDAAS